MNQNTDLTNFHGSNNEVCKLILTGLEGIGKTTFLNEICGEHFDTSDGRSGCLIKDNQRGSFFVDGFARRNELNDMLGINYKNPGEW
jgi:GTPase SAR1 family protein